MIVLHQILLFITIGASIQGHVLFDEETMFLKDDPTSIKEYKSIEQNKVKQTYDGVSDDVKTDCNSFRTCKDCIKSVNNCDWCHNFGCTNNVDKDCPYATNSNLKLCPYIEHGTILLPAGHRTHIAVKLHPGDPMIRNMDVTCQIKLKNRLTHLKGMIFEDMVYCYPIKLGAYNKTVFGSFRVIWGGVERFSNEVSLTVFSCGSDSCETCATIAPEYGCGWCDETSGCVTANQCEDFMKWSLSRQKCVFIRKKIFFV